MYFGIFDVDVFGIDAIPFFALHVGVESQKEKRATGRTCAEPSTSNNTPAPSFLASCRAQLSGSI
jgi:hypothetical protein